MLFVVILVKVVMMMMMMIDSSIQDNIIELVNCAYLLNILLIERWNFFKSSWKSNKKEENNIVNINKRPNCPKKQYLSFPPISLFYNTKSIDNTKIDAWFKWLLTTKTTKKRRRTKAFFYPFVPFLTPPKSFIVTVAFSKKKINRWLFFLWSKYKTKNYKTSKYKIIVFQNQGNI